MDTPEPPWRQVTSWANLLLAYRKAKRGKANNREVLRFTFLLEQELSSLRTQLLARTYRPGAYRQFEVVDRKRRLISAAPFRDRVVQHAVMNVVEPGNDRLFISDCYASRSGKGVHAAVRRYQQWAGRYAYALKVDVSRYFDSIDHARLRLKLRETVDDQAVLWLFDRIIASSPTPREPRPWSGQHRRVGLPLGNVTSQFFGNLYLNALDHALKDRLFVVAYLRYVDDLILLSDSKQQLREWCAEIEALLQEEGLRLHPTKRLLVPTRVGLDVLGYRVFPHRIRLGRGSGYRFRRRLRRMAARYAEDRMGWPAIDVRVQGWCGHAMQADTRGLRRAIFGSVSFRRGGRIGPSPGCSGRFVEQRTTEPPFVEPQQEQSR